MNIIVIIEKEELIIELKDIISSNVNYNNSIVV